MVSTFQMQPFYRQSALTVDTTHAQKFFDEDDSAFVDESLLDHSAIDSGLEMSPPMTASRRDSFAVSTSLFSPKTEDWQSVDMQSVPSNNPFLEPQHSNNPFTRPDQTQGAFVAQGPAWMGPNTPMHYDGLDAGLEGNHSIFHQRPMHMQTPFSNPGNQVTLFSAVGPQGQSIPASPQKDWMNKDVKNQPMRNQMRPDSPAIRSYNEQRRGDGIRKKNVRQEIPAERNLHTIDHLIASSTDENQIKELKQQKRLLRNRQAALDSRQRKKMHTERLEDEKKQFTTVITGLEEEMAEMNMKMQQLLREKDYLQSHIESMAIEKEEMVQNHTIETGELRKKVSVLSEHVQRLESAPMAGNTGFSSNFNEMEGLNMDGSWDNMGFMGEFPMEQEMKQEVQIVPAKKPEPAVSLDADKPAQGGLIFMLFLVGAFVLSNRSTPTIPRVSDDVREASATLLDSIFKDAGVAGLRGDEMAPAAPQPSGANWAASASVGNGMEGVASSALGDLHDSLTQPTQDQTNEQLFSLSAAQYNAVNDQDFLRNPPTRSTSQGRRNLADALATMRGSSNNNNNEKSSAAEVYSRSLLWDQIPSDVVRNFAKMVAECSNAENGQPHGHESNT